MRRGRGRPVRVTGRPRPSAFGARPAPGGPAKACAMSSHRSASAPSRPYGEVGAVRPLGDQQAEVERGAGDALGGVLGAVRPQLARAGPVEFDAELLARAASSPRTPKAKSRARTPMRTTCRSRSVGGRTTPSASATSWPWAQVSMSRAVAMEAADMGGPYQGKRAPVGRGAQRLVAGRRAPHASRRAAGGRQRGALLGALVDEASPGAASAFSTSRREGLRVGDGEQRGPVGPGEMRDLVGDGPARRGGREGPAVLAPTPPPAGRVPRSPGADRRSRTTGRTRCAPLGARRCAVRCARSMAAPTETSKRACMN